MDSVCVVTHSVCVLQTDVLRGGRVEHGEALGDAALRETKEEAGIDITLEGVLRFEHSVMGKGARLRAIFFARPKDDLQKPKSKPDDESEEARYMTLAEFQHLIEHDREKLRSGEPYAWFAYVEKKGPVYPLSVLASEHDPVKV